MAVTTAILLVVLIMLTALVVDIGLLRMDERESQLSADLAASAAFLPASDFDPLAPGAGRDACLNAWSYLLANVEGLPGYSATEVPSGGAPCDAFTSGAVCDPLNPVEVTSNVEAGPYTLQLTYPVLEFDPGDAAVLSDQLMSRIDNSDGEPCERFGVRVIRDRDFVLAGVAGFVASSTQPAAVSRFIPGDDDHFASLIVLDQIRCQTLVVSGQGGIEVSDYIHLPDPTKNVPGEITVDSAATLPGSSAPNGQCGNAYALDVFGTTQGYARAEGAVNSFAMETGNTAKAYEASDLTTVTADGGVKLSVPPTPNGRQYRSPVDHVVNCEETYPAAPAAPAAPALPYHPQHEVVTPPGCDDWATVPPYVARLRASLQTRDLRVDPDWTVYPDDFVAHGTITSPTPCTAQTLAINVGDPVTDASTMTVETVHPNLYVNCGTTGSTTFSPTNVSTNGVTHIVSQNEIVVGSNSFLTVNGDPNRGTVLYLRNGDVTKDSSGTISFVDTFVYLDDLTGGSVGIGASDTVIRWRGPGTDVGGTADDLKAACQAYVTAYPVGASTPPAVEAAMPPAGCFAPVALWSNGTSQHTLGGQGALDIAGTFFTPNAMPFRLGGQGNQNLDAAQFFSRQLEVAGQGLITMVPNPDTNVATSSPRTSLIR